MTYTTVLSIGKAMIYDRKREAGIRNPPPVRLVDAMRASEETTEPSESAEGAE